MQNKDYWRYVVFILICTILCFLVPYFPKAVDNESKREIPESSKGMRESVCIGCSNEDCDGLPEGMTECYHCIYNSWDDDLKTYTKEMCEIYDIPYEYVLGIIYNESRFKPEVTSEFEGTTNYGLMQINSVTFDFLNEEIGLESCEDLLDPKTNILAGIKLLCYHREYTDTDRDMILRYQVGEGNYNTMKANGQHSIPALKNVLNKANQFKEII